MTRLISIATLITIMIAMFASLTVTHAATNQTEMRMVTIVDFDPKTDYWRGALHSADGDSVKAIKFTVVGDDWEDMFPAYGDQLTMTLNINTNGYTGYASIYSAEYGKMLTVRYTDYLDDEHIIGYVTAENGYSSATLDGDYVQITGFVVNGSCIKLRSANPNSVHGFGWLVQNGNLLRYVIENGEESTPTPSNHTVVLPLIML